MAEKKNKFFDEFPPVSTEAWQNKIIADLKGADFEKKLVWRTNEGFNVQPYYRQEHLEKVKYLDTLPGTYPFVRGAKINSNNWYIRQDIKVASLEGANKKALEILNKGVNSLGFIFDDCTKLTPRDITVLLKDIRLDSIDTTLVCNNIETAINFVNYISENYKNNSISASVNINPLDTLTVKGYLSDTDLNGLKPLMEKTAALKKFRTTAITGKNFRDAGSNIVQELAFSLAMGAEYLTKLTDEGLDALTATSKLKFNMGVGTNYFMEIVVVMAWWAGRGQPPLAQRDWLGVLGLGFIGYYLSRMLDFAGLQYITASLERLILYLGPTLVLLLGWALRGRRITRGQLAATAVSYCGALLVFGIELRVAPTGATAWGALLVFISTFTYALYLFYSGEFVQRLGSLRLVGLATAFACVCCIAQFLLVKPLAAAQVAPEVIWLSVLNATVCTAVPVLLVMMAVERLGPSLASQVGMIGPLSTIAMGIVILGEPFTPWLAAGTALVVAGIFMFSRTGR